MCQGRETENTGQGSMGSVPSEHTFGKYPWDARGGRALCQSRPLLKAPTCPVGSGPWPSTSWAHLAMSFLPSLFCYFEPASSILPQVFPYVLSSAWSVLPSYPLILQASAFPDPTQLVSNVWLPCWAVNANEGRLYVHLAHRHLPSTCTYYSLSK